MISTVIQEAENLEISISNIDNDYSLIEHETFTRQSNGVETDKDIKEMCESISSIQKTNNCEGFKSAKGSSLSITKTALEKVKNIFEEHIDSECGPVYNDPTNQKDQSYVDEAMPISNPTSNTMCSPKKFMGFASAAGKQVDISKDALAKVKNLFSDEAEDIAENTDTRFSLDKENYPLKTIGFASAAGKTVEISKESLARVKNIFNDENLIDNEFKSESRRTLVAENGSKRFAGFASATGKKVEISRQSLAKVKDLFNDVDVAVTDEKYKSESRQTFNANKNGPMKFEGFSSATGKKVDISKEALAKVQNIFTEETDETENIERTATKLHTTSKTENGPKSFVGFTSATGKSVEISKDALAKVKTIFKESEEENGEKTVTKAEPTLHSGNTPKKFVGFSSANGKTVAISKESLAVVKNIFNDGETVDVNDERTETPSSDSTKHAKHLFSDIDSAPEKSEKSENASVAQNNKKRKLEVNDVPEREDKKSCHHELLEDDFDIDTQALAELEQKAFGGNKEQAHTPKRTTRIQSRLRIIGIPKVTDETVELRAKERQKQLKLIADKRKENITHMGMINYLSIYI